MGRRRYASESGGLGLGLGCLKSWGKEKGKRGGEGG